MNAERDQGETPDSGEGAKKKEPQWSVVLMGRTDTSAFFEVRDGLGGVWSGSLGKIQ